jgi:hypothetical protein
MSQNLEFKGLIDIIINKFLDIMSIKPFQPKVNDYLRKEYMRAMERVESELRPDINFIPSNDELSFLNDYVFQNLQSHADQIGNQLRQELQRGILNKETPSQLKQRVKEVFNDSKYTNRLKTVMRTEKLRANNAGAYSAAEQATNSGIVLKKYLDITHDGRTSDICLAEMKKYGKKEQAIPLDEEFVVRVTNKTYRAQYPPFHPNCRTVIRFVREDK